MKKQLLAVAAGCIVGSMTLPVQAAPVNRNQIAVGTANVRAISWQQRLPGLNDMSGESILTQLEAKGIRCQIIMLPCPGKPDVPDTDTPDVPDMDAPETDTPDVDVPDMDAPDTDTPDVDAPDTDVPDTDIPDADIPDGNQPDKDPSGTQPPENEGNDTEDDVQEMTYEEQVVALVNAERKKLGLKEVTLDKEIEQAAFVRAVEIETSFSHTRPNGSSFSTVLKENGISYRGSGENIAWGQTSPEAVMKAWMNSDGHRANILNAKFTKMGVGYYQNTSGRKHWVQLFTY